MNILANYIANNVCDNRSNKSIGSLCYVNSSLSPKLDSFEKRVSIISPNFTGRTSNGNFLRNITGLRDPYSGVVILTQRQFDKIKVKLGSEKTIRKKLKILAEYETSMLPVEKEMYERFCISAKKDKNTTFKQVLSEQKKFALKKLIKEESVVFDRIENASIGISREHEKKVSELLASARADILKNGDDGCQFKRKGFIHSLVRIRQDELLDKIEEKMALSPYDATDVNKLQDARFALLYGKYDTNCNGNSPLELTKSLQEKYIPETLKDKDDTLPLIDIAHRLPTSKNSVNAFIVKYDERSDREIAERILDQSVMTIEHIKPYSKGGKNEAANFMAATKATNEEKGNDSLPQYMKIRKNVPIHLQEYLDDIINVAHKGHLGGHEWYPYLFVDTIKEEAHVKLNTRGYKIPPEIAFKTLPPRLKDDYPEYSKYIPERIEPLNIKV